MRSPEQIEELLDKVEDLLAEIATSQDKFSREDWRTRHEADFSQLEDKLKTLNGDDFDIYNASYDEFHNDFNDLGEDVYCSKLVENIKNVFDRVWPEATEEEKQEAAEEVAEEIEEGDKPEETTTIETNDPEVAEDVVDEITDKPDELTSDESSKEDSSILKHPGRDGKKFWGNPSKSGGRDGKSGISDERAKEAPVREEVTDEVSEDDEVAKLRKDVEAEKARYTRK